MSDVRRRYLRLAAAALAVAGLAVAGLAVACSRDRDGAQVTAGSTTTSPDTVGLSTTPPDTATSTTTATSTPVVDDTLCDTPEGRNASEVLGVSAPVVSADRLEGTTVCSFERDGLYVRYWYLDVQPDQFGAMESDGGLGIDVGDESFLVVSTNRSGRWTAQSGVRIGQRAVWVELRSDAAGSDTYPPVEGPAVEPTVRDTATAVVTRLAGALG